MPDDTENVCLLGKWRAPAQNDAFDHLRHSCVTCCLGTNSRRDHELETEPDQAVYLPTFPDIETKLRQRTLWPGLCGCLGQCGGFRRFPQISPRCWSFFTGGLEIMSAVLIALPASRIVTDKSRATHGGHLIAGRKVLLMDASSRTSSD